MCFPFIGPQLRFRKSLIFGSPVFVKDCEAFFKNNEHSNSNKRFNDILKEVVKCADVDAQGE